MNTYVERIDNALRVMRSIKDEEFHINAWPHCVLGHCSHDAWFNAHGFTFGTQGINIPCYENEKGTAAGSMFFGISFDVAHRLFVAPDPILGSAYATRNPKRKEAIAHLEVLKMKKLAEFQTGEKIEAKDFVAAEA